MWRSRIHNDIWRHLYSISGSLCVHIIVFRFFLFPLVRPCSCVRYRICSNGSEEIGRDSLRFNSLNWQLCAIMRIKNKCNVNVNVSGEGNTCLVSIHSREWTTFSKVEHTRKFRVIASSGWCPRVLVSPDRIVERQPWRCQGVIKQKDVIFFLRPLFHHRFENHKSIGSTRFQAERTTIRRRKWIHRPTFSFSVSNDCRVNFSRVSTYLVAHFRYVSFWV